jgi:hypothetical protein
MKTILLLIVISILLIGCENRTPQKPFIIVDKNTYFDSSKMCHYEYSDKKLRLFTFVERSDKYNIGDTIK